MSPARSKLERRLRRVIIGLRLWRRDRGLWRLKERADHSRMLSELYWDRWSRDERFNRGNPLDRMAAERYEQRTEELEREIADYSESKRVTPPEHSMLQSR